MLDDGGWIKETASLSLRGAEYCGWKMVLQLEPQNFREPLVYFPRIGLSI